MEFTKKKLCYWKIFGQIVECLIDFIEVNGKKICSTYKEDTMNN